MSIMTNMGNPDEYTAGANGIGTEPLPGYADNIMAAQNGTPNEQQITDIINAPTNDVENIPFMNGTTPAQHQDPADEPQYLPQ